MIYVLDFETNGLTINDIEITQCSYIKLDKNLEVIDEYNKHFYVENLKDSAQFTGLDHKTLANLSGGDEMDKETLRDIAEELKHGIIIGQNINYDLMVLDAITHREGMHVYPKYPLDIINQYSPIDTLMNLEWIVNNNITEEGKKLLEEKFGKSGESKYHDALYDIYSVYAVIKFDKEFRKRLNNYLITVPRKEML